MKDAKQKAEIRQVTSLYRLSRFTHAIASLSLGILHETVIIHASIAWQLLLTIIYELHNRCSKTFTL